VRAICACFSMPRRREAAQRRGLCKMIHERMPARHAPVVGGAKPRSLRAESARLLMRQHRDELVIQESRVPSICEKTFCSS